MVVIESVQQAVFLSVGTDEASRHTHNVDEHAFVWLERHIGEASTVDRHTYCRDCGAVKQLENHGRPVSFFVQGIANLVSDLERSGTLRITQAEARLMMKAVCRCAELNDSFSTTIDTQLDRFAGIVRSYRPILTEEFAIRSLFRKRMAKEGRR